MANRNIKITLTNEEEKFLKWLAKRDGIGIYEELHNLFYLQLSEEMELHKDEFKGDQR